MDIILVGNGHIICLFGSALLFILVKFDCLLNVAFRLFAFIYFVLRKVIDLLVIDR